MSCSKYHHDLDQGHIVKNKHRFSSSNLYNAEYFRYNNQYRYSRGIGFYIFFFRCKIKHKNKPLLLFLKFTFKNLHRFAARPYRICIIEHFFSFCRSMIRSAVPAAYKSKLLISIFYTTYCFRL